MKLAFATALAVPVLRQEVRGGGTSGSRLEASADSGNALSALRRLPIAQIGWNPARSDKSVWP